MSNEPGILNKETKADSSISRDEVLARLDHRAPYFWLATWFGSGLLRPAPGTWGTAASVPFAILIYALSGLTGLIISAALIYIIGHWAADKFEKASQSHDNSMIVIDETAGYFIAAFAVNGSLLSFLLAFILFRIFDVIKPWPISWVDKKVDGAFGVMIDDVIAGIFAALSLWGIYAIT